MLLLRTGWTILWNSKTSAWTGARYNIGICCLTKWKAGAFLPAAEGMLLSVYTIADWISTDQETQQFSHLLCQEIFRILFPIEISQTPEVAYFREDWARIRCSPASEAWPLSTNEFQIHWAAEKKNVERAHLHIRFT